MTALLESQITTIIIMICCGITAGLVYEVFSVVIVKFTSGEKAKTIILRLCCYIIIAFIIGEFIMFCQNGKLMFYEFASFLAGLMLWKKLV